MKKLRNIVKLASSFLPTKKTVKKSLDCLHFEIQGNTLLKITARDFNIGFVGNFFSDNIITSEYNAILIDKKFLKQFSLCNDNDIIQIYKNEADDNLILQIGNIKFQGIDVFTYPIIDMDIFVNTVNVGDNFINKLEFASSAIRGKTHAYTMMRSSATNFICANFKEGFIVGTNQEIMNFATHDFFGNENVEKILIRKESFKIFKHLKRDLKTIKISNLVNRHFALFDLSLPDCYGIIELEHPEVNTFPYLDVVHDNKYCTDIFHFNRTEMLTILKKFEKLVSPDENIPEVVTLTFDGNILKATHFQSGLSELLIGLNAGSQNKKFSFQLDSLIKTITSQPDEKLRFRFQEKTDCLQVIDGDSNYMSFSMPYEIKN